MSNRFLRFVGVVVSALKPGAVDEHERRRIYRIRRIVVFGGLAVLLLAAIMGTVAIVHAVAGGGRSDGDAVRSSQQTNAGKGADAQTEGKSDSSTAENGEGGQDNKASDGKSADDQAADVMPGDLITAPLSDEQRATLLAQSEQTANDSGQPVTQYTYCIATNGDVGDATVFADTVFATLHSPDGWARAGATFEEGAGDACDMTLILSEAQYMSSYAAGCSDAYSCRVGDQVVINLDRWNSATDAWADGGGTLARYRTMVINHEVGHRLGHIDNETTCGGDGQSAPLMQQQSMDLRGCVPNEWPLDSELWVG